MSGPPRDSDDRPLEIERTYLLSAMPTLPADDRCLGVLQIEQGYLPATAPHNAGPRAAQESSEAETTLHAEGRLRRTVHPDGTVTLVNTIKSGTGLVRTEVERAVSIDDFERLWPLTTGRRLAKRRHRVREGDRVWEIDQFVDLDLLLAEVELPSPEAIAAIPAWLAPVVVREVTDEPAFRNYELACRALARG